MNKKNHKFNLFKEIFTAFHLQKITIKNGDIIIISSKYISSAQGRALDLSSINVSIDGYKLSKKFKIIPEIAEIIIREADCIFGGVNGYVLTESNNMLAPNAGIDKSNIMNDKVILYPHDSFLIAQQLKRSFFLKYHVNVGIIITDSRLAPSRIGTTGIAIACAGMNPVWDRRSDIDLTGNKLKVTRQATADNLASIANHLMGEGNDSKPIAIIRNSNIEITNREIKSDEMNIPYEQCIYIRSLIASTFNV
ncbi:MAG: coenzyme F420-0:L-glutamate ligase [Thaumarchaeota archaeon]|nr:coenzyme F420-0:L-glutamate ligase [Nitrososphaerota archaeon]